MAAVGTTQQWTVSAFTTESPNTDLKMLNRAKFLWSIYSNVSSNVSQDLAEAMVNYSSRERLGNTSATQSSNEFTIFNDSNSKRFGSIFDFTNQSFSSIFDEYPPKLMDFASYSFTIFSILGIFGNFISIWALSRYQKLQNATTAFIISLCVGDLLLSCFSMPMSALSFFERGWSYGKVLCKLFPLIRYSNGAVSLESLLAITINRYVLVVHPRIYNKVYKPRNVIIMVAVIWLSTFVVLLFPLLEVWGRFGYDPNVGTCTILPLNGSSPKTLYYALGFALPSSMFIFCYVRIYFVVQKSSETIRKSSVPMRLNEISFTKTNWFIPQSYRHSEMTSSEPKKKHDRKELKVLKVMLVIFITFLITFLPVAFVKIFRQEDDLPILNVFGYLGVYFSSIINPLIYIVMSKEYRKAYTELFYKRKSRKLSRYRSKNQTLV